ncbi:MULTISPECIES: hypothetical protein [Calothrix]|uniref:Uncharacterized protein n=2 Tax=Calothrix TaxID=1186 RepID=A0ABR8A9A9_9CYAN|nr:MULTISPECIES: hypothetical protein [Calothrix]MBD2196035.1 hypothetical protein [Calothrix parietina FACHB-288]MBD2224475.1 hypothetical protein [Calothrix anomala FACHB-343]
MPLRGVVGFETKMDVEINYAIAFGQNFAQIDFAWGRRGHGSAMPLRGVVGFVTKIDVEINYAIAFAKHRPSDKFCVGV